MPARALSAISAARPARRILARMGRIACLGRHASAGAAPWRAWGAVAAALALAGGCGGALAAGDPEPFVGLESLCSAPLQVTVRQPTAGELQQMELVSGTDIMVTYAVVQTGVAVGMVGAGVLPTLGAMSVAVFGVILPLTYGVGKAWESSRRHTLEQAIAEVEFNRITEATLRRRLPAACTPGEGSEAGQLEVLVLGYGLRSGSPGSACAHGVAQVRLQLPGQAVQTRRVAAGERSEQPDVPPPHCAEVERFVEHGGALARQAVGDVAATLGALIARQLRNTP